MIIIWNDFNESHRKHLFQKQIVYIKLSEMQMAKSTMGHLGKSILSQYHISSCATQQLKEENTSVD